ncbi:MAG: diiron oxygenase [Holophagaceae bacterium]
MTRPTLTADRPAGAWPTYDYDAILDASERVTWRVEDLIGGRNHLDFSRPFMPESFARTEALDFLSDRERLVLNQIRGHNYLYLFGLTEEFILPFVLDHARPMLSGHDTRTRAFLNFAGEEAKHIELFKRFRKDFLDFFGSHCDVIGPPEVIARTILAKHPLAIALVILHIEWMTQRHFQDSVLEDGSLDPQFKSLLRHHWMEEAQHAKLDTLMVQALAEACTPAERAAAIDGYLEFGMLLDGGLMQQTAFDLEALQRATGRVLTPAETVTFLEVQEQAMRWTFLGSGMSHPAFLAVADLVHPGAAARLEALAPQFS